MTTDTRRADDAMIPLPGGEVWIGSDRHYPEEAPARQVQVSPFRIDVHPVTNRQFARFVAETGYVTMAERPMDPARYPGVDPRRLKPGAMVFDPPRTGAARHWSSWWTYVPGACWRKPEGRGSVYRGRLDHPVVCVAYEDAAAFAAWAGKDLPTEAEWEMAARGGLERATYAWGEARRPGGRIMANTWTGAFPAQNLAEHGFTRTSPVRSFPPNGHGVFDMIGNVWEWTGDYYVRGQSGCCGPEASYDPDLPEVKIPRRVVKGGSHLCHESYCDRYRPAARQPQMEDTATTHIGFRCVARG